MSEVAPHYGRAIERRVVEKAGASGRWFQLSLSDAFVRTMNRAEYYAARSYLRRVARELRGSLRDLRHVARIQ